MHDNTEQNEIPLGFGMALAQNAQAMDRFSQLSEDEKQSVLAGARGVGSAREMREYVDSFLCRSE